MFLARWCTSSFQTWSAEFLERNLTPFDVSKALNSQDLKTIMYHQKKFKIPLMNSNKDAAILLLQRGHSLVANFNISFSVFYCWLNFSPPFWRKKKVFLLCVLQVKISSVSDNSSFETQIWLHFCITFCARMLTSVKYCSVFNPML